MNKTPIWEIDEPIGETIFKERQSAAELRTKPDASESKSGAAPRIKPFSGKVKSRSPLSDKRASNEMEFKIVRRSTRLKNNPAVSFSLSMLMPGAGQLYNRQRKLGAGLMLFTMISLTVLLLTATQWRESVSSFMANNVSSFLTFMVCGILYFAAILFWFLNTLHAYYMTSKERRSRYMGTTLFFLPPLCSLVLPGWGQFLNGQSKKGLFFMTFTVAGLVTVPCLFIFPSLFPALTTNVHRYIVEWIFAAALFIMPAVCFAWVLSLFDAYKVAVDDMKREPLKNRIEYMMNRIRMQGIYQGVIPHAKLTLGLTAALVFTFLIGYFLFPKDDYVNLLQNHRTRMANQQMVILPSLADKLLGDNRFVISTPNTSDLPFDWSRDQGPFPLLFEHGREVPAM